MGSQIIRRRSGERLVTIAIVLAFAFTIAVLASQVRSILPATGSEVQPGGAWIAPHPHEHKSGFMPGQPPPAACVVQDNCRPTLGEVLAKKSGR